MEANAFYNSWNSYVASKDTMEHLSAFGKEDNLDILLDDIPAEQYEESSNLINDSDFDDMLGIVMEPQSTQQAIEQSVETNVAEIDDIHNEAVLKDTIKCVYFSVKSTEFKDATTDDLRQSLLKFCDRYDYNVFDGSFSKIISAIIRQQYNEIDAIIKWLELRWGVHKDNCEFDNKILEYSEIELDSICCNRRNMLLSELITLVYYKDSNLFDASVIKYMSLEPRDTGLLCQLMDTGRFNREEAVLYLYDTEVFNSYLTLKLSDRYDPDTFNKVCNEKESVSVYTDSLLSGSPWVFLGGHKDFSAIVKLVTEKEIPIDVAKEYCDSPYLLAILQGYSKGIFDKRLINNYLLDSSDMSDVVATDYANCHVDLEILKKYDSDFFLAKLIYDINQFGVHDNRLCAILHDDVIRRDLSLYCENLCLFKFREECTTADIMCINRSLVQNSDEGFHSIYLRFVQEYQSFVSFNQIWFSILLDKLNINANISQNIGGLLLVQNNENISYLNTQMLCESLDSILKLIREKLQEIKVQLLPNCSGILISDKNYQSFNNELNRFMNYSKCVPSIIQASLDNACLYMTRYNTVLIMNKATDNLNLHVSENFKQLLLLPAETYLMFDNVLNLIATQFTEFIGICSCNEALQCLKLLHATLIYESHLQVQIEFLKTYLSLKFGKRIIFERYNLEALDNLNSIEVRNSQHYVSATLQKVLGELDNFVTELNKKSHMVGKFVAPGKLIIEGV